MLGAEVFDMRTVLLVVAALLSIASASRSSYSPQSSEAPQGVSDEDLYAATVRVFVEQGFTLRDKEPEAGLVRTELVEVDSMLGQHTMHGWRAVITDGIIVLSIDCEVLDPTLGRSECPNNRIDSWIKRMPELRAAIMDEAVHHAQKKRKAKAQPAQEIAPPQTAPNAGP